MNVFCFMNIADDFKKAQNKLKLCQYLSDVASEIEEPILNIPSKRQRNKPLRYAISDSSDEENTPIPSKLKPPPRLNISFTNCVEGPSGNNIIILHYFISNISYAFFIIFNYNIISDKAVINPNISKIDNILITTNQLEQPIRKYSSIERNSLSPTNIENVEPQIDVNKAIHNIYMTLAFLKRQNVDMYNQNEQILQIIKECNNIGTTTKSNEKPQLPCILPMTTLEDITRLEEYLKKEENLLTLVK